MSSNHLPFKEQRRNFSILEREREFQRLEAEGTKEEMIENGGNEWGDESGKKIVWGGGCIDMLGRK